MTAELARKMHRTLEVYHGIVYFAPEPAARYEALGLGGRSGYFASRSAAMGAVDAEVVVATFFNFNPDLVRRALDGVWARVSPDQVLDARHAGADEMLRRTVGDAIDSDEMVEASEIARRAATGLEPAGRPLFAAHARLPWPDEPHMVLWHAQTLIREFRGDGHIACLVEAGVDSGCAALVQHAATGEITADALRMSRSWSEQDWDATVARLAERGWVEPDGSATAEGARVRQAIEDRTDELAMAPWNSIGTDDADRLRTLVRPFSRAIVAAGGFGLDAAQQG
jgi:hypothetical protein